MFFPAESLRRGGRFYLCWVADSWPLRFATLTHRQLWSQDIRRICEDLLEVIKNESGRPTNRFSLRLSSQLLRGVVRLYQRKVSVFMGELCMIDARVMKVTNKKWASEDDEPATVQRRPQLAPLVIEEVPDEERVAERIENSGNVVANIEDITLREPTLPQNQILLDDGFGEMQVQEQVMEVMRAGDHREQLSALSISVNETARSRLEVSTFRPVMEGVSEHDISAFKKSMGESQLPAADFEKEIPDMPEIHPDLPAPVIDNGKGPDIEIAQPQEQAQKEGSSERRREEEEFVLEELQDVAGLAPKRRRKNKLIVDKTIKLPSQFMASRIENINVELRCESSSADVISKLVPAAILLGRPAHAGHKLHSTLGYAITRAFIRRCDAPDHLADDREMEKALTARQRRASIRASQKQAREPVEVMPDLRPVQQELLPEVSNIPMDVSNVPANVSIMPDVDISFLPTQIVVTSPQKRPSQLEKSPKRKRHSGYITFRLSKQLEEIAREANDKENVPQNYPAPVDIIMDAHDKENFPENYQAVVDNMGLNKENVPDNQQNANQLTQMLYAEGLADDKRTAEGERRRLSESSETPLGSLDRTKVSLGDSEKTTDSKRFIRDEWGTQGTMHKIYAAVKARRAHLSDAAVRVESLVASGPVLAGHQRVIAARCFTSILKLKQHGFIRVHKDPETNEILDIELGSKIIERK
ncbi:uncharacterized protein LOC121739951 isoform X2 [Aricia agestis]|uniref:uncharacterized protein LOC121739951 isoform X2 n=1 Tax=Aricia agestis TaxID=91739 RepID=UPI001C2040AA|nr:uncharacterized protein LOC121739951 isoform X2 [Aricia agestis]